MVWEKSPASVPVMPMLVMLKVVLPVLVRVTAFAVLGVLRSWVAKLRLVGTSFTTVPVPASATVWGFGGAALSAIDMSALRVPFAVGVKLRLMVHLAPTARLEPHVWLC